ncbi:MAG: PAS domain-containing sensor histidine kinase [Ignavibacteriae bacterium]|nr:PAS domain-containing sensor histidine kinase [Ignavibacteriota bacterium]NOG98425.1 PAS domain-containing sensor histidine kinase [Ignavibacteriota bacterium]
MEDIFKSAIENLPVPALFLNEKGIIKFANITAKEIFNSDKLEEKNIRDIIPFPETKKIDEIISCDQKFNIIIPIGEILFDFVIKGNNKFNLAQMYGFDVTDLKRKERALNLAISQADEVKQMEKDFLAKVSHEVRSPLLVIEGFTELLIGEIDNNLRDEFEPFFYAINNSGKRLIRAFDLVLHNYQLHTRIYHPIFEKVNLREAVQNTHKAFYSFATEKKIKFTTHFNLTEDPIIETDQNSVEQILAILINNAFSFTLQGKISLQVYDTGDKIAVDVMDSGTGIPDDLFGILNRYFSGEYKGSLSSYEITGLGLETVKMFCDLIEAEMTVKTVYGEGSVFTFKVKKMNKKITEKKENQASNIYYLPSTKKPGNVI